MKRNLAIIGGIVLLDQLTKLYIQISFTQLDILPIIPGVFNIVHAENPGAAFSMLADAPIVVRKAVLLGLSGVVMAIVGYLLFRPQKHGETPITQIGLAMVLGGAIGNFWDRAVIGTVTDFLQVFLGSYEYPSFNIADSAIFCGAGLLLFDLWKNRKSNPA